MKVVIIGGVAGGATAAARLRRLDERAEIIVFERSSYVSYANCGLPYYIGGTIKYPHAQTPVSYINLLAHLKSRKVLFPVLRRKKKKIMCM